MQLPLILGKSSSNEPFSIDLAALPHLFISYAEEEHLVTMLNNFSSQLITAAGEEQILIAVAVIRQHADAILKNVPAKNCFRLFITNETVNNEPESSQVFMRTVFKEFKKRTIWKAKQELQKSNKKLLSTLIIFSDDILQLVVIGRKRITGLYFVQLLLMGPQVNMHFIVASAASFFNLLQQLMRIHSSVKSVLEKNNIYVKTIPNKALGAELILSGEGLLFFKSSQSNIYTKLYP